MNELALIETLHPDDDAAAAHDALIGINDHKQQLVDELVALLDPGRIVAWRKRHHAAGLALVERRKHATPLVLLGGDVGCGKSALANSVGTPVARAIDRRVVSMETPSDIRGTGHVGELSARITHAFGLARRRARDIGAGLLLVDEADDVATARSQNQAHHEDRAGLNVLIKQVDQLASSGDPLAVILLTNRHQVLDPAVRRRTALHLTFTRPDSTARAAVFEQVFAGVKNLKKRIPDLVKATERDAPYTYSDLVDRLGRAVLREAQRHDQPVTVDLVLQCISRLQPSPLMEDADASF